MTNLVAHVFDAAGNMASSTVEVIVDNQVQPPPTVDTEPPVVSIINPVAGNVSGKVTISVDASDDSGAAGITLSIYNIDHIECNRYWQHPGHQLEYPPQESQCWHAYHPDSSKGRSREHH